METIEAGREGAAEEIELPAQFTCDYHDGRVVKVLCRESGTLYVDEEIDGRVRCRIAISGHVLADFARFVSTCAALASTPTPGDNDG